MSCGPCNEKKGQQTSMTRGEFIGAGAAAAVASLGTAGALAAESQVPQVACGKPPLCGPDAQPTWSMPASVLQIIWGDIFPRFVAYMWRNSIYPAPLPFPNGNVTAADFIAAIHQYISELAIAGEANANCSGTPPICGLTVAGLTPFERRAKRVIDHLSSGGTQMPIRLMGVGGFDFILSDSGLDLFAPPKPTDEAEMLRYYQFRNTGRSAIGIPGYLDAADALAFDVQSPVGPSQILLDNQAFTGTSVKIGADCTLEDLDCLEFEEGDGTDAELNPRWQGPIRKFTVTGFLAAAAKARCWQLEGSVYRGILEQLPRVVATIWREQVTSCTGPTSYHARFTNAGGSHPDGVRDVFKERLETSLPAAADMVFETATGLTDVMISNQGLRFPVGGAPPTLNNMFAAIATGRAGNPVFTDSRRPPRDL